MLMSFMKIEGDLGRLQHLIEIKPYIIHLTTNTLHLIKLYGGKFVSDLWHVSRSLGTPVASTNIKLTVALLLKHC
jgi:hypothetical protein